MTLDRIMTAIKHNEVFAKGARGPNQTLSNINDWDRSSDSSVVVAMNGILISVVEEDRRVFNINVGGICSMVV